MRHGQLRGPNGVRHVDVEEGVVPGGAVGVVPGLGGLAGQVPEARPVRLVHAGARAQHVDVAKFAARDGEHVCERGPRRHVRLDKDGARPPAGRRGARRFTGAVLGDQSLRLGSEAKVCEDDVAVARQEEGREGEVDA